MELITWEYYNSHFNKLDEAQFNKVKYTAERLVLKRIRKSADELTENEKTDVIDCISCIINQVLSDERYSNGIQSISNDGYSVSYSESLDTKSKIDEILRMWVDYLMVGDFIVF